MQKLQQDQQRNDTALHYQQSYFREQLLLSPGNSRCHLWGPTRVFRAPAGRVTNKNKLVQKKEKSLEVPIIFKHIIIVLCYFVYVFFLLLVCPMCSYVFFVSCFMLSYVLFICLFVLMFFLKKCVFLYSLCFFHFLVFSLVYMCFWVFHLCGPNPNSFLLIGSPMLLDDILNDTLSFGWFIFFFSQGTVGAASQQQQQQQQQKLGSRLIFRRGSKWHFDDVYVTLKSSQLHGFLVVVCVQCLQKCHSFSSAKCESTSRIFTTFWLDMSPPT